ncbi:copper resistance protein B [Novosphingobium album (ex Hu et al. 2023)]|uniref:Copper resistance protein B n=1 Tax=Novosphingobium album (ex Hu et al. 2023) TaxID=2930093 RepID=A0ABT0B782_9SPHN|nr:copper resistance protein B [Novosphingobium album (ex Hu et al. 2023)]MCJ2180925.1 copper resistance protein B [Novosphingobium album (ex Hu et al. 2023)]
MHQDLPRKPAFTLALVLSCLAAALPVAAAAQDDDAGATSASFGQIEMMEVHLSEGTNHVFLDNTFYAGDASDGAMLKIEGGSDVGPTLDQMTAQVLYAHTFGNGVQVMMGARRDFRSGPELNHAVLAFSGSPASWLSLEHFLFLSEKGDVSGAAQAVGSFPLSEQLTLEPRVAVSWTPSAIPSEEAGAGLGELDTSVRLRRSLGPVFNLYVGVIHERLTGGTRRIAKAQGDSGQATHAIIGFGANF